MNRPRRCVCLYKYKYWYGLIIFCQFRERTISSTVLVGWGSMCDCFAEYNCGANWNRTNAREIITRVHWCITLFILYWLNIKCCFPKPIQSPIVAKGLESLCVSVEAIRIQRKRHNKRITRNNHQNPSTSIRDY